MRLLHSLNLPDSGPVVRSQWGAWLTERPGHGWFYPMADHIHFGTQIDANVFRQWAMASA